MKNIENLNLKNYIPKVSIITASYNYGSFIKETIESVINQTFQDWEMIVVDDGSKDNSVEIIKTYCKKDSRIKLFQHENGINKGLAETIQLGIKNAQSEWIVFLESDDTITEDYIVEKVNVIRNFSNVDFIFNDVNMFGNTEIINEYKLKYFNIVHSIISDLKYPNKMFKAFRKFGSWYNLVPTFSTVMLKKNMLEGIDFNSPIKKWLDWYIWLQIVAKRKYNFFYINKKLTNWRKHSNSYDDGKIIDNKSFLIFGIKKSILLLDVVGLLKTIKFIYKNNPAKKPL